MRRLFKLPLLLVLGIVGMALVGPWGAAEALAGATAQASGACSPVITSWSTFEAAQDPAFTVKGTCFGTGGQFTSTDSSAFRVTAFPPGTTVAEMSGVMGGGAGTGLMWWSACSSRTDSVNHGEGNGLTCSVSSWSPTSITFSAITGALYGHSNFAGFPHTFEYDYAIKDGDRLAVQVWNSQTLVGPATIYITAGAAAGSSAGAPVASKPAASKPAPSKPKASKPAVRKPASNQRTANTGGACKPSITGYSTMAIGPEPALTIYGNCFGTTGSYTGTDEPYFQIRDYGTAGLQQVRQGFQTATPPSKWNACSTHLNQGFGLDGITCTVRWSNTSITVENFNGLYSSLYTVQRNDVMAVLVWNSQTSLEVDETTPPAAVFFRAGSPGTSLASPAPASSQKRSSVTGKPVVNARVSSIAASLVRPSKAFSSLKSDAIDLVITLALVMFITFPSNLFNSTFQENYADIVAWWEKWTGRLLPRGLRRRISAGYRKTADEALGVTGLAGGTAGKKLDREKVGFASVLLGGALLGALLDPSFGLNFRTVLSYVAIVVAMVAGVVISGLVTGGYHRVRKHGHVPYKLEALPVGLLIGAVCVVISRSTGFEPGYLYGVICGIAFTRPLAKHEEGHVVALGAWVKVVLAIVAWLVWATITHDATKPGSFFGIVLVDDFLASLFVSSLVGTVISLFPLRFLPGHKLQSWHKGVWAATFGVSLFVLVQVLLRPHSTSSGPSHAPLVTTIVLFLLFCVGSVLFRDHFAKKRKREEAAAKAAGGEISGEAGGVIALDKQDAVELSEKPTPVGSVGGGEPEGAPVSRGPGPG